VPVGGKVIDLHPFPSHRIQTFLHPHRSVSCSLVGWDRS
jgi:hypothetical protein